MHFRTLAPAAVAALACLAPVVAASPAQAAPAAPASSATTYTAAPSQSWTYTAPGVTARVTVAQVAGTVYRVSITGTAQTAAPTTIPASTSSGLMVPVGPYRMASGHGVMDLTKTAATFRFDPGYLRSYGGPFTFAGEWVAVVTTAQTSTQAITVGGKTYTIGVHAPAASGRATGQGRRIMESQTYEVDNATLTSPAVVKAYFAADDDGALFHRELAPLWQSRALAKDFREAYTFVTVQVPKNPTVAEKLAAINAALPKGWPQLATTARQAPSGATVDRQHPVQVVTAWELDTAHGAKPTAQGAAAWGPRHTLYETYTASSTHR